MANLVEDGMTIRQLADFLAAHTLFVNDIMGGKITTDAQVAVLMENFGVVADSNDPQSAGSQAQAYFAQQIDAGIGFGQIVDQKFFLREVGLRLLRDRFRFLQSHLQILLYFWEIEHAH